MLARRWMLSVLVALVLWPAAAHGQTALRKSPTAGQSLLPVARIRVAGNALALPFILIIGKRPIRSTGPGARQPIDASDMEG